MSNSSIVQFDEFPVSLETMRSLPKDQVSALGVLGFAINEANVLMRVFLSQTHQVTGNRVIDEAANIQKLVILRVWSSKIFETIEFLKSLGGKKPATEDRLLRKLAKDALDDLERSTVSEGAQVANDIRHEISNHYPFSAAKKNLAHVHNDALCGFYVHRHGGNDFFPFGEAVMFHGRLHRRWKLDKTLDERMRKFLLWLDWCQDATSSLGRANANFINEILFTALGRKTLYRKTYWVPNSFVGHPVERLTPVFSRLDKDQ